MSEMAEQYRRLGKVRQEKLYSISDMKTRLKILFNTGKIGLLTKNEVNKFFVELERERDQSGVNIVQVEKKK